MGDNLTSKLGGKIVHSQSREIVSNVYQFMKKEARGNAVSVPLAKARLRTKIATGVSEREITRINSELRKLRTNEDNVLNSFSTPNKNQKRKKPITGIDDFDKCVIRRLVYDFHTIRKRLPTVKLLLQELRERIGFKGCERSLRIILKDIGFKWRKTENNRKILIETPDIREKRIFYLRSLKRFRDEGRPIIFVDESYILSTHVSSKSWSDMSVNCVKTPISKGERLIILNAGSEKGFVPNALTMWKASSHSGDYHDNVNTDIFMKWIEEKILPNLEPRSVLVIDNAPYHNLQIDKAPTSKSRKQEYKDWLGKHEIPYSDDMLVPELYKLVVLHKPRFVRYLLDETVQREGHNILRLPPYHPDLNVIELIWADVKNFVAKRNVSCKFEEMKALAEQKFLSMGAEDWKNKCEHVKKIENEYASREPVIDNLIESFIVSLNSDSESSEHSDFLSGVEELDEDLE